MKTIEVLHRQWKHYYRTISPGTLIYILNENLFPRKIVTLGVVLLFLDLFMLMLMVKGILPSTFELSLLALVISVTGSAMWVVGVTIYVGKTRI